MKNHHRQRLELAAKPMVCLAFGGVGMVIIMCFLIGFGIHSVIGKTAIYLCWLMMAGSLLTLALRERSVCRKRRKASGKMSRVRLLFRIVWHLATVLLLASLLAIVLGASRSNEWVRYSCLLGVCLTPFGWLGMLLCLHRGWQAAAVNEEKQTDETRNRTKGEPS